MSLLQRLIPINLQEEKEKFFTDNNYNPQFVYESSFSTKMLQKHGTPDKKLVDKAQKIIDQTFAQYSALQLQDLEGPKLTQNEVIKKINIFLKMHGLAKRFEIIFSSSFISRTSITTDKIKLRLPVNFRQRGLIGMLYHEIGTHALRRINYEKQPWYKQNKKLNLHDYLPTEEGLASLHSLLPQKYQLAHRAALRYLAVDFAQHHSFAKLWQFLKPYTDDSEQRWIMTYRQKRGLTDTNKPGGFTKDLTYFAGLVKVWQYLQQHNFDITNLYHGKLAIEDINKATIITSTFKPILPSFFTIDKQHYMQQMIQIGKINELLNI